MKIKLIALLFTMLLSVGCITNKQEKQVNVLSPTEFKSQSLNKVIIDIRTPQEFSRGHIEGAININYFDRTFIEEFKKYKQTDSLFLYCKSGKRTTSASTKLSTLGYKNIFDLEGGIGNWSKNNLQITK